MPALFEHKPSYQERRRAVRRRRAGLIAVLSIALVIAGMVIVRSGAEEGGQATAATATLRVTSTQTTTAEAPAATTSAAVAAGRPADRTRLRLATTITGDISPKSVVSSGTGYVTAQNMMYRHSVTVYDARTMRLIKTIPDSVELAKFGYGGHPGVSQGSPVEASFSPDGQYEYVSNYSMYGANFGPEATDTCTPSSGYDRSFVYRINMEGWNIDRVYKVGVVPKVVKATPDGRYVLATNWCSWDLSVIDPKAGREVRRVPIGAYPRGIAVSPKGDAAYVAIMGDMYLQRVDLKTWKTRRIAIGAGPRAIEFSPQGRYIYATLNDEGRVVRLDTFTGKVIGVATGDAPRSLTISTDGKAIYVVNYKSGTVSKVRTRDMQVLQTVEACGQPIGITYDAHTKRVWTACYDGQILVFNDR